ncbi:T9SS type A sorting domain-containing protein [Chryseobacterium jejuense]|uniref:T9SS type A sorting domain-containing protein n=1 Tax=Chryseobacterium jejuense TaxID=445960 RepID=UPI001AE8C6D8|nr:T9SS type A sorting domain-containing protein [Chryseobacterium jejuense]MBP2619362.1 hypothetical protein [Chryseobacterium jejuense]
MKKYLLAGCILKRAILLSLLMFITNTLVYAEKVYASSQAYQIFGSCLGCSVTSPENAVGSYEDDYAVIYMDEMEPGNKIEQTLIFPSVITNGKVVIGFQIEDILTLDRVFVETFNGNISNNDSKVVRNIFIPILSPNSIGKGTIEFSTNKPYDRIVLRYESGPDTPHNYALYYAYQIEIPPIPISEQQVYVSSQSSQTSGICVLCSVQNAENVVGSDENSYAFMNIPLGALASVEQRLSFPSVKTNSKVVIGIGTNQVGLSVQLLGGVSVETFNGNVSNNDFKIVNNEILKIGATDPSRGTIEITTTKPYDRVVLKLSSAVGLNGGLRVYYAYQLNRVYASNETHELPEGCKCSIQNPQNAVGPNEIDFSKLIQNINENPRKVVSQSLHFPGAKTYTKLVIGISSNSKPIVQVFDNEVEIVTTGVSGPTYLSGGLKTDPQNPNKGTIEFITFEPYTSVGFTMKQTLYATHDLNIHYAYQENVYNPAAATSAHAMKTVPAEKVLTLFPNPTRGQVTLQGNIDFTDADIFINNTFGKEVFRSKFRAKTIDLPATLPGGVYMLSVQTKDKETYTHKIILTR